MKSTYLHKKKIKAFLLLEAALAVLAVVLISLFIFKGFGLFTRSARKNKSFTELAMLSSNQAWSIYAWPLNSTETDSEDQRFSQRITAYETDYKNIMKNSLEISNIKSNDKFDIIFYLPNQEQ